MSVPIGARLGPYEILSPLGAGGMGEVYRARDTRLGRVVAVKVLPPRLAETPELRQRFEREARAISMLSHPNICALYDVGEASGVEEGDAARSGASSAPRSSTVHYLVMEYLEGEPLSERLARGALPIGQLLTFAVEIAAALDRAHRAGIVHRDLKPGNVMLTKSGVKLLDFGLAKLVPRSESEALLSELSTAPREALTEAGSVFGTFQYMAPEQLEGKQADARTDIFAFGCVLFEMATGRPAFKAESRARIAAAILTAQPPAISSVRSGGTRGIDRVVERCLAKDPEDRWQSARDLELELRSLQGSATDEPARVGSLKRGRGASIAWAAVLLILAVLAARGLLRRPAPAAAPVVRFTLDFPADAPLAPVPGLLAFSPDGKRIAYVRESEGKRRIYLRALDENSDVPVAGTESAFCPFFSPDGQWLGFAADGKLKKVPLAGGAPTVLCDAPHLRGGTWSPDDAIVFAPDRISGLFRVSADGGTPEPLTRRATGELAHAWPQILPGGKSVLYQVSTGLASEPVAAVVWLKTGKSRVVLKECEYPRYVSSGKIVYRRGSHLMAVPFDLHSLSETGPPVSILDDLSQTIEEEPFAISEAGSIVYLPLGTGEYPPGTLVWVDRGGKGKPTGAPIRRYAFPNLSPHGRRVAVTIVEQNVLQVWLLDLERGALSPFTLDGWNHFNVWTPDGRRLIFSSVRTGAANLYWENADGSAPAERLTYSPHHEDPGSCSPDGRFVAYAEIDPATQWDIWVLPLAPPRTPRVFRRTRFSEFNPMFSRDGRFIAYTSDESGVPQVYVEPFPGPGARTQISIEEGYEPAWSRDGRELFYRAGSKMMAVRVKTAISFEASRPEMLFDAKYSTSPGFGSPAYDIAADGRFLMIKESGGGLVHLNIVLNRLADTGSR
jgi:eukaryotic-like serine/threonine-protein kinase